VRRVHASGIVGWLEHRSRSYKEHDSKFTGKIHKVTIELKDMKAAEKKEGEKAHVEVAHKKALAD
jgi:hypothetical protein